MTISRWFQNRNNVYLDASFQPNTTLGVGHLRSIAQVLNEALLDHRSKALPLVLIYVLDPYKLMGFLTLPC
jgi:hypothetical protein